jgi:Ion transport protein
LTDLLLPSLFPVCPPAQILFLSTFLKENTTLINQIKTFLSFSPSPCQFQIILSKRQIAKKYLLGLFTFDLMTNIPFFLSLVSDTERYHQIFDFIKMLALFRIFRLLTFARYCQRILFRVGVNDKYLDLFKLLFFWIIAIHWAACLHLIPGLIVGGFNHKFNNKTVVVNAWFEKEIFQKHSYFGRYVVCLFKTVKSFMGAGDIKDLQPKEYFDKLYASALAILGRIGLCVTLAYIYETFQGIKSSSLR